jgi:hypothetical protein
VAPDQTGATPRSTLPPDSTTRGALWRAKVPLINAVADRPGARRGSLALHQGTIAGDRVSSTAMTSSTISNERPGDMPDA